MLFNMKIKDINMLVSIFNTKLRDSYDSLDSLCEDEEINIDELIKELNKHGFEYIESINQIKLK